MQPGMNQAYDLALDMGLPFIYVPNEHFYFFTEIITQKFVN